MKLSQLFSVCAFGHDEPIKVTHGSVLHFECSRCQADLGVVLAGQKFKQRKAVKVRKRKSADVLALAERKRA